MLEDARQWYNSKQFGDVAHTKVFYLIKLKNIFCGSNKSHVTIQSNQFFFLFKSFEKYKKTGATALHVASAKGYLKVMGLLMQGGAAVNSQGKIRTIAAYHLKQILF